MKAFSTMPVRSNVYGSEIDDALIAETEDLIVQARKAAMNDQIPEPLEDSPKCPRCSLVGICLPDETNALRARALRFEERRPVQISLFGDDEDVAAAEVRQLVPARNDLRPLYLNSQGFRVGKSGEVIQVRDGDSSQTGSSPRRSVADQPFRKRAAFDASSAGILLSRSSCLLLFAGWLVLRHHEWPECTKCILAASAIRSAGYESIALSRSAQTRCWKDTQSAHPTSEESYRTTRSSLAPAENPGRKRLKRRRNSTACWD